MSKVLSAEQRERPAPHMPGEAGIWAFIVGDLLIFSLLFATFLFYRSEDVAVFTESQAALDERLGVLNTVLMLTSSLFVAMAVAAVRERRKALPSLLLLGAFACGAGFGVVKVFEYGAKIRHGITVETNDFFMFYFVMTGIHMLHVVIGMGVLLFLASYCKARGGVYGDADVRNIESGSCFWHVVDLLWIVLFALLYLVR